MKTLSIVLGAMVLASTALSTSYASPIRKSVPQDESGREVPIISYFNKGDSLVYWTNSERRQVKDGDTVLVRKSREKFSLTVIDSTRAGYRIEYKYLGYESDTTCITENERIAFEFARRMSDELIGKSLVFRTDEYGQILSYEREGKLKKEAWKMVKALRTEMSNIWVVDSLKALGVDADKLIDKYFDSIDIDNLVKQGLKDLEFMFALHGTMQYTGEVRNYTPRSETQYETSSYMEVSVDDDRGEYAVYTIQNRVVTAEDAASLLGAIVQEVSESMSQEELGKEVSDEIRNSFTDDVLIRRENYWQFFPDGWPAVVVDIVVIQSPDIYREDTKNIVFDSYYRVQGSK